MLVITGLALLWFGLVPVAGAFVERRRWRLWRKRLAELSQRPLLDYASYREEGVFRLSASFESLDGETLWLTNGDLTVPVLLGGAKTYVLPGDEEAEADTSKEAFLGETPRLIRWDRLSSLSASKVFVGGALAFREGRLSFVSLKEQPLTLIFYDGSGSSFMSRAIRSGRHGNEYWNPITPYALILGVLSLIIMAVHFLPRPAFRLTALASFIAVFTPLFPLLPPGILFTLLYRTLWQEGRVCRACRDLVSLPLAYLDPGTGQGRLPGGAPYGCVKLEGPPPADLPRLIPGGRKRGATDWYVAGVLDGGALPARPQDPFAPYGAIPGRPDQLARRYSFLAWALPLLSWIVLLAGIGLNVSFIGIIVYLLGWGR